MSPDERFVAVSNLFDGFDWYSLSDRAIRHTIPIRINPQKNLPVPVIFAANGDVVIIGGTNRGARVLDSRTSETTQLLPHDGTSHNFHAIFKNTHVHIQVISYRLLFVFIHICPVPPLRTTLLLGRLRLQRWNQNHCGWCV